MSLDWRTELDREAQNPELQYESQAKMEEETTIYGQLPVNVY